MYHFVVTHVHVLIHQQIYVIRCSSFISGYTDLLRYNLKCVRGQLKCDGTRAETRFRLSAKRTSQFKSAGASVQSTTGSRGVCISGSNAGYTMFRGSVKSNGYPLHWPVSPSLPLPCVAVCHHISTGVCRRSSLHYSTCIQLPCLRAKYLFPMKRLVLKYRPGSKMNHFSMSVY